jgi:hypothetical protein
MSRSAGCSLGRLRSSELAWGRLSAHGAAQGGPARAGRSLGALLAGAGQLTVDRMRGRGPVSGRGGAGRSRRYAAAHQVTSSQRQRWRGPRKGHRPEAHRRHSGRPRGGMGARPSSSASTIRATRRSSPRPRPASCAVTCRSSRRSVTRCLAWAWPRAEGGWR